MKLHYLSSGSKGNLTLLQVGEFNILIDVGLSARRIVAKLEERNIDPNSITHIFITHEHSDHVAGLEVFLKKYEPVVCLTKSTYKQINGRIKNELHPFLLEKNAVNEFAGFDCHVLEMSHDAIDPVGFVFYWKDKKYVHVTDTGYLHMKHYDVLKNADAYFMESNHDVKMLMEGKYPWNLRKRIISDLGHLSNIDCAYHLNNLVGTKTKVVVLGHISDDNNTKQLAYDALTETFDTHQTPYDHLEIYTIEQLETLDEIEVT